MPGLKSIADVPNFVSKEEHTALVGSTPTSFNDIPPILKHKEENVSVAIDPAFEVSRAKTLFKEHFIF